MGCGGGRPLHLRYIVDLPQARNVANLAYPYSIQAGIPVRVKVG